jgi:hypothetical protein
MLRFQPFADKAGKSGIVFCNQNSHKLIKGHLFLRHEAQQSKARRAILKQLFRKHMGINANAEPWIMDDRWNCGAGKH